MINSVIARAKELQAEGYDYEYIYATLQAQRVDKNVIIAALKAISHEHTSEIKPPKQYDDIYHIIESTIYSQPPKEIIKVLTTVTSFGQIIPIEHSNTIDLEYLIHYCQNQENSSIIDELHETLKPYIQNMIEHLELLSRFDNKIQPNTPLEQKIIDRYIEWFGLWSPEMQASYREALRKEEDFSSEIDIVYDYDDRGRTFCPMYKTEINVSTICEKCPFFLEIYDEENDEIIKKCKFRK